MQTRTVATASDGFIESILNQVEEQINTGVANILQGINHQEMSFLEKSGLQDAFNAIKEKAQGVSSSGRLGVRSFSNRQLIELSIIDCLTGYQEGNEGIWNEDCVPLGVGRLLLSREDINSTGSYALSVGDSLRMYIENRIISDVLSHYDRGEEGSNEWKAFIDLFEIVSVGDKQQIQRRTHLPSN